MSGFVCDVSSRAKEESGLSIDVAWLSKSQKH